MFLLQPTEITLRCTSKSKLVYRKFSDYSPHDLIILGVGDLGNELLFVRKALL